MMRKAASALACLRRVDAAAVLLEVAGEPVGDGCCPDRDGVGDISDVGPWRGKGARSPARPRTAPLWLQALDGRPWPVLVHMKSVGLRLGDRAGGLTCFIRSSFHLPSTLKCAVAPSITASIRLCVT